MASKQARGEQSALTLILVGFGGGADGGGSAAKVGQRVGQEQRDVLGNLQQAEIAVARRSISVHVPHNYPEIISERSVMDLRQALVDQASHGRNSDVSTKTWCDFEFDASRLILFLHKSRCENPARNVAGGPSIGHPKTHQKSRRPANVHRATFPS